MALKRRKFTRELKLQVVREVEAGKPIAQAAREYDIHPTQITKWRQLHRQYAGPTSRSSWPKPRRLAVRGVGRGTLPRPNSAGVAGQR
jgi:transposase-like protein